MMNIPFFKMGLFVYKGISKLSWYLAEWKAVLSAIEKVT